MHHRRLTYGRNTLEAFGELSDGLRVVGQHMSHDHGLCILRQDEVMVLTNDAAVIQTNGGSTNDVVLEDTCSGLLAVEDPPEDLWVVSW